MWIPRTRAEVIAYLRGSAVVLAIILSADYFWDGFGFAEIWYLWIVAALAFPFVGMNLIAPD
jgi:hypothetical protein